MPTLRRAFTANMDSSPQRPQPLSYTDRAEAVRMSVER